MAKTKDEILLEKLDNLIRLLALQIASDRSVTEGAQALKLAGLDNKTNIFRALNIKLTDKINTANREIVSEMLERHKLDKSIIDEVNSLNNELKKNYRGKLKFDFCLEGYEIDKLRTRNEKIRRKYLETSGDLSRLQSHLEKQLLKQKDKP